MTNTMKTFLDYVDTHEEMAQAIRKLNREANEADAKAKLAALAAEAGFELTDADLAAMKPEGEMSDEEAAKAAGGGWGNCQMGYESGDTPQFRIGEHVYSRDGFTTYDGQVISVSSTKNGGIWYKEFTYSVRWDRTRNHITDRWSDKSYIEKNVYESELTIYPIK